MISRVTACSFKCIIRHILPSCRLLLWRLRNREGVAMSVFGAAEGREREGWDKALCKRKVTARHFLTQIKIW